MKIRKFAAIDIGSNAIRLLVHNVIEETGKETKFSKSALFRIPVRLGDDSFTVGEISAHNVHRILQTMEAFKLLMETMGVEKYMACATSAMREATNGIEIIEDIRKATGIPVEIIDGKKEAAIIAGSDLKSLIQKELSYLYIDVGGGSTEYTLFSHGKILVSKSFKLGTVRVLNNLVGEGVWKKVAAWIKEVTAELPDLSIIGSGGNINKLHKMSGRREGEPLSYRWIKTQFQLLEEMSYEDRISLLGLNPDRADVIIPATKIFLLSAKWSHVKKIHVPRIGLSDGIIKTLYYTPEKL